MWAFNERYFSRSTSRKIAILLESKLVFSVCFSFVKIFLCLDFRSAKQMFQETWSAVTEDVTTSASRLRQEQKKWSGQSNTV